MVPLEAVGRAWPVPLLHQAAICLSNPTFKRSASRCRLSLQRREMVTMHPSIAFEPLCAWHPYACISRLGRQPHLAKRTVLPVRRPGWGLIPTFLQPTKSLKPPGNRSARTHRLGGANIYAGGCPPRGRAASFSLSLRLHAIAAERGGSPSVCHPPCKAQEGFGEALMVSPLLFLSTSPLR